MILPEEYQWTFQIKDVVHFDGATITVNANTYRGALKKIVSLKLPELKTYDSVEEGLKFLSVLEHTCEIDGGEDGEEVRGDEEDN